MELNKITPRIVAGIMLPEPLEFLGASSQGKRSTYRSTFMKAKHTGAKSRKHGCGRCKKHKPVVFPFTKATGKRYTLCLGCAKAVGKI